MLLHITAYCMLLHIAAAIDVHGLDWDAAFGPTKVTGEPEFITDGMTRC
jgi:hypothetical protein